MAHHDFDMPITEAQVRALRVNDTVTLQRHALRHPRRDADPHVRPGPHDALRPERPRGDPHRAEREVGRRDRSDHPSGYEPVCIGTTTSARMERFTRPLMEQYGVRIIIGKGGLARASRDAFARARRRLSRDHRRHGGARDDVDRADRGRRPRRSQSRIAVEVPRQGLRPAAGRDGQPRRQPLSPSGCATPRRPPRRGARRARRAA